MIYGYARISTKEQSIDRQIRNIRATFPDALIVEEVYTGKTQDRPKWTALQPELKPGDTIVFDSVSRMSRNAAEGFEAYLCLFKMGIELIFLKEPMINTETYKSALKGQINASTGTDADIILEAVNKYLLRIAERQIQLAFEQSQKEVDDLRQRTREGMLTAKLAGRTAGRKAGVRIHTEQERKVKNKMLRKAAAFGGDKSDAEMIRLCKVSKMTYYRYKKELLNEAGQVPGQLSLPIEK